MGYVILLRSAGLRGLYVMQGVGSLWGLRGDVACMCETDDVEGTLKRLRSRLSKYHVTSGYYKVRLSVSRPIFHGLHLAYLRGRRRRGRSVGTQCGLCLADAQKPLRTEFVRVECGGVVNFY